MPGSSVIEHKGRRIVYLDFADADTKQVFDAIESGKPLIRTQPEGSVLVLLDISRSTYTKEITNALKDFASGNKPYIKMTAVVGVEGIKKVVMDGVLLVTGRKNMVMKNTLEEAKEYLASL